MGRKGRGLDASESGLPRGQWRTVENPSREVSFVHVCLSVVWLCEDAYTIKIPFVLL